MYEDKIVCTFIFLIFNTNAIWVVPLAVNETLHTYKFYNFFVCFLKIFAIIYLGLIFFSFFHFSVGTYTYDIVYIYATAALKFCYSIFK